MLVLLKDPAEDHWRKGYFKVSVHNGRKAPTVREQREVNASTRPLFVSVCACVRACGCVCVHVT